MELIRTRGEHGFRWEPIYRQKELQTFPLGGRHIWSKIRTVKQNVNELKLGMKSQWHLDLLLQILKNNKCLLSYASKLGTDGTKVQRRSKFSEGVQCTQVRCSFSRFKNITLASHSPLVFGPFGPRTRSSNGTCWMKMKSSGIGKYGVSICPKLNSTAQLWQRTCGNKALSARQSFPILNATPRSCPFLE